MAWSPSEFDVLGAEGHAPFPIVPGFVVETHNPSVHGSGFKFIVPSLESCLCNCRSR